MWYLLLYLSPALAYLKSPLTRNEVLPSTIQSDFGLLEDLSPLQSDKNATEIDLINYRNTHYIGYLAIGTPPKNFTFIIDTGSNWLWVPSSSCKTCHDSKKFDSAKSSSYKSSEEIQELTYDDGFVKGNVSTDAVYIGDPPLIALNQTFLLVEEERDLDKLKADGIIGLGLQGTQDGHSTFIESLKTQKIIKKALFSIYLSNDEFDDNDTKPKSALTIGEYKLSKYAKSDSDESSIVWVNIENSINWQVPIESFSYNGSPIISIETVGILATGTSKILAPQQIFDSIVSQIKSSHECEGDTEEFSCVCGSLKEFGSLELVIAGSKFQIEARSYIYQVKNTCLFSLGHTSHDYWVLGDAFLREYYSIYDMENKKVGLVRAKIALVIEGDDNSSDYSVGDLSTVLIVLIVITCVVVAASLVICFVYERRRRRNKAAPRLSYELLRSGEMRRLN
jgi:hypothetical protein